MAGVRLDCPLCGATAHNAPHPPQPGRCPRCTARFDGGGDRPQDAALTVLAHIGAGGDPETLARGLFAADHTTAGLAITSDRRDGFYAWWVFWTPEAELLITELATPAPSGSH